MMKNRYALVLIPVVLVAFALAFSFLFAAAPVQASGQAAGAFLQTTPLPTIGVDIDVTAVVPDTGAQQQPANPGFFTSWIVWLALGLAVIALVAALIARGRPTTEIHEHHDHYD